MPAETLDIPEPVKPCQRNSAEDRGASRCKTPISPRIPAPVRFTPKERMIVGYRISTTAPRPCGLHANGAHDWQLPGGKHQCPMNRIARNAPFESPIPESRILCCFLLTGSVDWRLPDYEKRKAPTFSRLVSPKEERQNPKLVSTGSVLNCSAKFRDGLKTSTGRIRCVPLDGWQG
jgi:hypothetical protein